MAVHIQNQFSFDATLVDGAVLVPEGAFIEIDDLAFTVNEMGRKIAQTLSIDVDGKQVSVAYVDGDGSVYDLVLASDQPVVLGTFEEIQAGQRELFASLLTAFGGVGQFTPREMVTAIEWARYNPKLLVSEVVDYARERVKRSEWIVKNRYDAMVLAPMDWSTLDL